jgi:hypothetical protein
MGPPVGGKYVLTVPFTPTILAYFKTREIGGASRQSRIARSVFLNRKIIFQWGASGSSPLVACP